MATIERLPLPPTIELKVRCAETILELVRSRQYGWAGQMELLDRVERLIGEIREELMAGPKYVLKPHVERRSHDG